MRAHELAKALKISSKDLLDILQKLGISLKSHSSTVPEDRIEEIKTKVREKKFEKKPSLTIIKPRISIDKLKAITPRVKIERKEVKAPEKPTASVAEPIGAPHIIPLSKPKKEVKKLTLVGLKEELEKKKAAEKDKRKKKDKYYDDFDKFSLREKEIRRKPKKRSRESGSVALEEIKPKEFEILETITVGQLAERLEVDAADILKKALDLGAMLTINQKIDRELVELIIPEYNFKAKYITVEDYGDLEVFDVEDDEKTLIPRPPVVTIMGHVDHGKTSLLDVIRKTNVTSEEFGGITQHIGAYLVKLPEGDIVFLDTPGHEAFTRMRARGAQVTDIVILVVAANDGVQPQTVEAVDHAKAAEVPIIVAINKMDLPDANPERIKQDLANLGLVPEQWGGTTIYAYVSAKKNQGIKELLEMILLQSEMLELKANPDRPATGTIIEAEIDRQKGILGTVLVQKGTLNVGNAFVAGVFYGKVRSMVNDLGIKVEHATPSLPVEITGFTGAPNAGDIFQVVPSERIAKQIAGKRQIRLKTRDLSRTVHISLDSLHTFIEEGKVKELKIILKADVQGSVEAIAESLQKLSTEAIKLHIIHSGAGAITESDVMLASASDAVIIGFNVRPDTNAIALSETEKVDIRTYRIIYDIISDIKNAMLGLLEPVYKEVYLGRAEIRQIFKLTKAGTVAGCFVLDGEIARDSKIRLIRDDKVIYEGKIESLKRVKDDVRKVASGFECGIKIENYNDIKEGDIIEAYTLEEVERTL